MASTSTDERPSARAAALAREHAPRTGLALPDRVYLFGFTARSLPACGMTVTLLPAVLHDGIHVSISTSSS